MNVLILTASTGGGHIRASNALKSYFKEKDNAINVNVVDTFKYINPLLDKTVTNGYLFSSARKDSGNERRFRSARSMYLSH